MRSNKSIILLAVAHGCVDVYQGAVAALVPGFLSVRAYGYAAASTIVLAASLLSSIAQPVFGILTDRWRMPWLIPVSTLLAAIGIGLSGVPESYALTLALVAVAGIGIAAYHPESARVARNASRGSPTAMATFVLGGNLGFAAAPLLVGVVISVGGLALTPLLIIPGALGALLSMMVMRRLPRQPRGSSLASMEGVDDWKSFLRLSGAVVFRSIVFVGLSTFIAIYADQRIGAGPVAGTAALFLLYLGGAVGTILGGRLAQNWSRPTVLRRAYLVAAFAVAGVILVPGPGIYAFVVLASMSLYVPFSVQTTLAQDFLPRRVGTASGVTLGLTVSIGGLSSPLIGRIADSTSLQIALLPLILLPLLGWLSVRTLTEPRIPERVSARGTIDRS